MQRTNNKAFYFSFFILHFSFMLSLSACSSLRGIGMNKDSRRAVATADSIIDFARQSLGKPYRYAARGPAAFDCSGFTSYVYAQFGYNLSHSSNGQSHQGRPVKKGIKHLQRGDIVVFSGRRISQTPGHVGIYIGPDPGGKSFSFIHAALTGVIISHLSEPYYQAPPLSCPRSSSPSHYRTAPLCPLFRRILLTGFASATNKTLLRHPLQRFCNGILLARHIEWRYLCVELEKESHETCRFSPLRLVADDVCRDGFRCPPSAERDTDIHQHRPRSCPGGTGADGRRATKPFIPS